MLIVSPLLTCVRSAEIGILEEGSRRPSAQARPLVLRPEDVSDSDED
jgi:hypothetical protein